MVTFTAYAVLTDMKSMVVLCSDWSVQYKPKPTYGICYRPIARVAADCTVGGFLV